MCCGCNIIMSDSSNMRRHTRKSCRNAKVVKVAVCLSSCYRPVVKGEIQPLVPTINDVAASSTRSDQSFAVTSGRIAILLPALPEAGQPIEAVAVNGIVPLVNNTIGLHLSKSRDTVDRH